jgi:hypothetical protein
MAEKKIKEVKKILGEMTNVTKDAFPIQYNLEPRFDAIQANFVKLWEHLYESAD